MTAKDPKALREIVARELYVQADAGYRGEWYTEPERRREWYRDKAQQFIDSLAASRIDIAWQL